MNSSAVTRKASSAQRAALTLIEARLPADPFLLMHFERFYAEVVELKARLASRSAQRSLSLNDVHDQLCSLLTNQEDEASQTGTLLGVEMYRQAERVMACMADEIFSPAASATGSPWPSLEMELFEADKAWGFALDGPCMKKLSLLLQVDDPAYRELAAVYFYALALNGSDQDEHRKLQQSLFEMICGRKGESVDNNCIFTQSYDHTLAGNRVSVLPSAGRWWLTLAIITILWLAVSSLLWIEVSNPVEKQLQNLQQELP